MTNRMDTIWSQLDRKSTAIAEFTMRQYRTRISTWVVMIASVVALLLMLLFYIEAMNTEIQAIDNDGDSVDTDGDGYPDGQERLGDKPRIMRKTSLLVLNLILLKSGLTRTISTGILWKMAPIMSAKMMMVIV